MGTINVQSLELIGVDHGDNMVRNIVWPAFPRLKVLEVYDINDNFDWSGLNTKSSSMESVTLHSYDVLR